MKMIFRTHPPPPPSRKPSLRRFIPAPQQSSSSLRRFFPAQEKKGGADSRTGFIRVANTVAPGTGNVNVLIDGKDVYPSGYKFGAVTGGIGLPSGRPMR